MFDKIKEQCNNYKSTKVPFCLRMFYFILIFVWCLGLYSFGQINRQIINTFELTVLKYQFWRFFISLFYEPSWIILLLSMINMYPLIGRLQTNNGTVIAIFQIFVQNLLIQFFIIAFQGILYFYGMNQYISSNGLAGIWLNFYFKCCYYKQQYKEKNCQNNLKPLYPIFMLFVVFIVTHQIRLDATIGILLAIIQCFFFNGGLILFTLDTFECKQWFAGIIKLNRLSCWSKLNPKISLNKRLTVSTKQFYEFLHTQIQNNESYNSTEEIEIDMAQQI